MATAQGIGTHRGDEGRPGHGRSARLGVCFAALVLALQWPWDIGGKRGCNSLPPERSDKAGHGACDLEVLPPSLSGHPTAELSVDGLARLGEDPGDLIT